MITPILDRRVPLSWEHVEKYPVRRLAAAPFIAERMLDIPRQYRDEYDQGTEGACVGYSQSWLMSMFNRMLYDAFRLYAAAQGIDEWADTPPAGGTSLRAGFDVLRTIGHWRVYAGRTRAPMLVEGIAENRWLTTVDQARAAIVWGLPLNLGLNWYRQFSSPTSRARHGDKPSSRRREYWIEHSPDSWGRLDGGHAITAVGVSDARQAFALCNTWGDAYPFLVWLPYAAFERLMREDGECGAVTDRVVGGNP
jgi:hypothetical protein